MFSKASVRKAGTKVRINVQLIDAETGGHVWAERYDRSLEDIFAVQDEVTRRVVAALKANLTNSEEARRVDRGKVNTEAYDYLMRARRCQFQFTAESQVEARAMLERGARASIRE
jgi:adenylate cyclase